MLRRVWAAIRGAVLLLMVLAACVAGLPLPMRRGRIASRTAATQRVRPVRRTVAAGPGFAFRAVHPTIRGGTVAFRITLPPVSGSERVAMR